MARETETFTGMIVKKHRSFFGKCWITLSDTKRTRKVECHPGLFDSFCEGMHITIVRYGDSLVSWRAPAHREHAPATAIAETVSYGHNKPLYYRSSRCFNNTPEVQICHQNQLTCQEIVSFDCLLFEHLPIRRADIEPPGPEHQVLAVSIAPETSPCAALVQDPRFTFCGYDLIEEQTQISAISDCGDGFPDVIPYPELNGFGLISDFAQARSICQRLADAYPDEPHADCVIVEIWRYITE